MLATERRRRKLSDGLDSASITITIQLKRRYGLEREDAEVNAGHQEGKERAGQGARTAGRERPNFVTETDEDLRMKVTKIGG